MLEFGNPFRLSTDTEHSANPFAFDNPFEAGSQPNGDASDEKQLGVFPFPAQEFEPLPRRGTVLMLHKKEEPVGPELSSDSIFTLGHDRPQCAWGAGPGDDDPKHEAVVALSEDKEPGEALDFAGDCKTSCALAESPPSPVRRRDQKLADSVSRLTRGNRWQSRPTESPPSPSRRPRSPARSDTSSGTLQSSTHSSALGEALRKGLSGQQVRRGGSPSLRKCASDFHASRGGSSNNGDMQSVKSSTSLLTTSSVQRNSEKVPAARTLQLYGGRVDLFSSLESMLDTTPQKHVQMDEFVDRAKQLSRSSSARAPRPAPDFRKTEAWQRAYAAKQRKSGVQEERERRSSSRPRLETPPRQPKKLSAGKSSARRPPPRPRSPPRTMPAMPCAPTRWTVKASPLLCSPKVNESVSSISTEDVESPVCRDRLLTQARLQEEVAVSRDHGPRQHHQANGFIERSHPEPRPPPVSVLEPAPVADVQPPLRRSNVQPSFRQANGVTEPSHADARPPTVLVPEPAPVVDVQPPFRQANGVTELGHAESRPPPKSLPEPASVVDVPPPFGQANGVTELSYAESRPPSMPLSEPASVMDAQASCPQRPWPQPSYNEFMSMIGPAGGGRTTGTDAVTRDDPVVASRRAWENGTGERSEAAGEQAVRPALSVGSATAGTLQQKTSMPQKCDDSLHASGDAVHADRRPAPEQEAAVPVLAQSPSADEPPLQAMQRLLSETWRHQQEDKADSPNPPVRFVAHTGEEPAPPPICSDLVEVRAQTPPPDSEASDYVFLGRLVATLPGGAPATGNGYGGPQPPKAVVECNFWQLRNDVVTSITNGYPPSAETSPRIVDGIAPGNGPQKEAECIRRSDQTAVSSAWENNARTNARWSGSMLKEQDGDALLAATAGCNTSSVRSADVRAIGQTVSGVGVHNDSGQVSAGVGCYGIREPGIELEGSATYSQHVMESTRSPEHAVLSAHRVVLQHQADLKESGSGFSTTHSQSYGALPPELRYSNEVGMAATESAAGRYAEQEARSSLEGETRVLGSGSQQLRPLAHAVPAHESRSSAEALSRPLSQTSDVQQERAAKAEVEARAAPPPRRLQQTRVSKYAATLSEDEDDDEDMPPWPHEM